MTDVDDDELTELVDADFPRVDLVGKGANGIPRFLIAKQDGESAGLLDPAFVRELIGKQAGDEDDRRERVTTPNGITVSGSPADIAAFIHKAAERDREREAAGVAKAEKSTKSINDLPDSDFAFIESGGTKDDEGKTVPRSLRHFPIMDAAHVRNALSRAPQSPFGDKAMPKIRSAARKFGIDVSKEAGVPETVAKDMGPDLDDGMDGMDPTVPLAAPEDDAPGDPADPGSPAWEAIDAATAQKWCSILARARVAVDLLAEREMLEAASADPDDAEHACDLHGVCDAIDYAISVLAPFAVSEQSEADCGEQDLMAAIGKAAAGAAEPVFVVESLGAVIAKSGRVLSAANEAHIREAAARLSTVLSSLPKAPTADDGQPVAKMTPETEADMPEPTPSAEVTAAAGQEPAMGAQDPAPVPQKAVTIAKDGGEFGLRPAADGGAEVIDRAGTVRARLAKEALAAATSWADVAGLAEAEVAKAGGEKAPMCVVYDQKGRLIGIVDPGDITPVANAEAEPDEAPPADGDAAADAGDMTPQPPADAGTPADDVAKAHDPAPPEGTQESTDTRTVLKSIVTEALGEILGAQGTAEGVAKQADVAALSGTLSDVLARLETVEKQDARPGVFANGAVPPPGSVPPARPALRGQDHGAGPAIDVAKAAEMKRQMYAADPADANRIANEMQQQAIDALAAIHARR